MPILFNFHRFLATFYTIFGTNILIQCPVLVPICCMFFVSQKTPYQTESKQNKNGRMFFLNIYEFWEEESMRDDAPRGPRGRGCAPGCQARPGPSWPLRKALGALLSPQESQYPDRNRVQRTTQSELRISGNIKNGERAESGTQKQRETERQIESRRGSRPSHAMETMDQRGNPSPTKG